MTTYQVTFTERVERLIVVEAASHEHAEAIATEFDKLNDSYLDEGAETIDGVVSFGTYTTALETTVEKE